MLFFCTTVPPTRHIGNRVPFPAKFTSSRPHTGAAFSLNVEILHSTHTRTIYIYIYCSTRRIVERQIVISRRCGAHITRRGGKVPSSLSERSSITAVAGHVPDILTGEKITAVSVRLHTHAYIYRISLYPSRNKRATIEITESNFDERLCT